MNKIKALEEQAKAKAHQERKFIDQFIKYEISEEEMLKGLK